MRPTVTGPLADPVQAAAVVKHKSAHMSQGAAASVAKAEGPKVVASGATPAWMKTHPLEGDGLLINFYNHMWKKNKDFQSCPGVRLPDTVVYDHNFPTGWFAYDQKNKELKKKQGKELDTTSILSTFSRSSDVDIVASYLYSYEHPETAECITSVEFFTREELADFLNNRKTKKEGVLQKFLAPKGLNNSLIQAVWSPRVCIVQRKTNRHSMLDKAYSAYERAVTYEGPSHYTEDGICAPKTTAQIKNICTNICQHFLNTEHKSITRMVLYFKVDKNDMVWLLWCGSVRISDKQHPLSTAVSPNPLNLSPIFTSPEQQKSTGERDMEDDGILHDVDLHQYKLSGDRVFQLTFGPNSANTTGPAHHLLPHSEASPAGSATASPRDHHLSHHAAPLPSDTLAAALEEAEARGEPEWYKADEHLYEHYKQLKEEHELASAMLDDVFYEAYSHFLRHESGAYFFSLPIQLRQIIGEEGVDRMLQHLRIQPIRGAMAANALDPIDVELGLDFCIPDNHHLPVSRLGAECQNWLKRFYDAKEQELKRSLNVPVSARLPNQPASSRSAESYQPTLNPPQATDEDEAEEEEE